MMCSCLFALPVAEIHAGEEPSLQLFEVLWIALNYYDSMVTFVNRNSVFPPMWSGFEPNVILTLIGLWSAFIERANGFSGVPDNSRYQTRTLTGMVRGTEGGSASLRHWGRDKMDAISQTIFSNAFSWMKMLELRLKFHWNLFLRVQFPIFQHWFR